MRIPIGAFKKMEKEEKRNKIKNKLSRFHDKNYKLLLLIPLSLLIFSFVYMGFFYAENQDFIYKDISLTGGTSITIHEKIDSESLIQALSNELEDIRVRKIYDLITREQIAVIIETKTNSEQAVESLENYLGYELTNENSSVEFTGSNLSESFYRQLLIAMLFAFLFMAVVVLIIFRTFVPSIAVITSAFADILMTLVLVNILGIKMSTAGIIALLMIIGYSVDTDILLTTRILKRDDDSINNRLFKAFKTGITMTLTSIFAIAAALIVVSSFSSVLSQIFTILVIGLSFDLLNTWITNVSILKWYVSKKKK